METTHGEKKGSEYKNLWKKHAQTIKQIIQAYIGGKRE